MRFLEKFVPSCFCVILVLGISGFGVASETIFTDLSQVLEVFEDSRTTRDLKMHGSDESKLSYVQTLEGTVYRPVDEAVIRHVQSDPEYHGKRVITHDYRTPGSDPFAVNTDRDVRVLVEVEPNRWLEIPARKWQDVYYREFARHTDFLGDVDTAKAADLQHHAERYRQLPTDRFHREASLDYSDQGRRVSYAVDKNGRVVRSIGAESTVQVDGAGQVHSTSQIARAKRGEGLLIDPEGLALMYQEKGADQYRRAEAVEQHLRSLGQDDPQRSYWESQRQMYETEGLMQSKKAVNSLMELRDGYRRMGFDVGDLPESMQKIFTEVQRMDGTSQTDLQRLRTLMQQADIDDFAKLNRILSAQVESIKLAPRRTVKAPEVPTLSTNWTRANAVSSWAKTALSLRDALKRAEQGSHLLWNFDQEDSSWERGLKATAVVAVDLIPEALTALKLAPISIMDALERGWAIDHEEQRFIEERIRMGEDGTWITHPFTSTLRVMGKVFYKTASSMTIDPLLLGVEAGVEGYRTGRDVLQNLTAHDRQVETLQTQHEMRQDYWGRGDAFGLGSLSVERSDGRTSLLSPFDPGELVVISTHRNGNWHDSFMAQWEWQLPGQAVQVLKRVETNEVNSNQIKWTIPEDDLGSVTVRLRIFDDSSGLQVDYTEVTLTLDNRARLGTLTADLLYSGGPKVTGPIDHGIPVVYTVTPVGNWLPEYILEWSVAGEVWKSGPATADGMTAWTLHTELLDIQPHQVFVELRDAERRRLDYFQMTLEFVDDQSANTEITEMWIAFADKPYESVYVTYLEDEPCVIARIQSATEALPLDVHLYLVDDQNNEVFGYHIHSISEPNLYLFTLPEWDRILEVIGAEPVAQLRVDLVVQDSLGGIDEFQAYFIVEQDVLTVIGPDNIEPEEWTEYRLVVPERFTGPLTIRFNSTPNLKVEWESDAVNGWVWGERQDAMLHESLYIEVQDSAGRTVKNFVDIGVYPSARSKEELPSDWFAEWEPSPEDVVLEHDWVGDVSSERLFEAIQDGDVNEVRRLIQSGVDVNKILDTNSYPYTPLMEAAHFLNREIVEILLEAGADARAVNSYSMNAISRTLALNYTIYPRISTMFGSELVALETMDSMAAAIIRILAKAGAEVNLMSNAGLTPLHNTVSQSSLLYVESARELLAAGAWANIKSEQISPKTPGEMAQEYLKEHERALENSDPSDRNWEWFSWSVSRLQQLVNIF